MINKTGQRITTIQEKTMRIKGETHVHLYKQHEIMKSYKVLQRCKNHTFQIHHRSPQINLH